MSVAFESRRDIGVLRGPNHGSEAPKSTSHQLPPSRAIAPGPPHRHRLLLIPSSPLSKAAPQSPLTENEDVVLEGSPGPSLASRSNIKFISSSNTKLRSSTPMRIFRSSTHLRQIISPASTPEKKEKKSNKPQMEKRRRQRINDCLDELKEFVLDVFDLNKSRQEKLEKADILEMTVKYFRHIKSKSTNTLNGEEPLYFIDSTPSKDFVSNNNNLGINPDLGNSFRVQSPISQRSSNGEQRVMILIPVPLSSTNTNSVDLPKAVNISANENVSSNSNQISSNSESLGEVIQQDMVSSGFGSAPVIQLSITNNMSGCTECTIRGPTSISDSGDKISEHKYCIGRNSPDTTTSDEPDSGRMKNCIGNSSNMEGRQKIDCIYNSVSPRRSKNEIEVSKCRKEKKKNRRTIAPKPDEGKQRENRGLGYVAQNQEVVDHLPDVENMWRPW